MRRKTVVVFFILLILNIEIVSGTQLFTINQINNTNSEQSISGNRILYVGGSGFGNYSQIQSALDASTDGDTVFVWDDSSPYFENIVIDKKISLIGENKQSTIIDGRGLADVITINAEGVTVTGFTIKNSKKDWLNAGVFLFSDKNTVSDNIIVNAENGIYSYDLDNTIIEKNQISNCENCGISTPFSSNNTIRDNTLHHCTNYGIFIYDSLYITVTNNTINDSGVGIHLWYSFFNTISQNTVIDSTTGLRFRLYSRNNTIAHNIVKDAREYGIELNYSFYNILTSNVVEHSHIGVRVYYSHENVIEQNNMVTDCVIGFNISYSPQNTISGNTITNSSVGMRLFSSSYNVIDQNIITGSTEIGLSFLEGNTENKVSDNTFMVNKKNAAFLNSVFTEWTHNYWDDWNGKGFYIINGKLYFISSVFSIPWVNIDLSPRDQPYFT
jgi:nitrous oxidase accessory protein